MNLFRRHRSPSTDARPAPPRGRSPPRPSPPAASFASRSRSRVPAHIPAYLHAALTDPIYLQRVLDALADREKRRHACMIRAGPDNPHAPAQGDAREGPPTDPQAYYAIRAGMAAQQEGKNRYAGAIVPYDFNRVLGASYAPHSPGPTCAGTDDRPGTSAEQGGSSPTRELADGEYLNASWVREQHGQKWWIAAQAPVQSTIHAFLSLCCAPVAPPGTAVPAGTVRARRVRAIVVLTRDVELRVRKADPYVPAAVGASLTYPAPPAHPQADPITVTLLARTPLPGQSTLSLLSVNGHEVSHYLYEGWPDHGVPLSSGPLLALMERVDEHLMDPLGLDPPGDEVGDGQGALGLVHCSAGIGRTGTWVALGSLLRWHGLLRPVGKPAPAPAAGAPAEAAHPAHKVSFAPAPPSRAHSHSPSSHPHPGNNMHNLPLPPPPPFGPSPLGPFPALAAPAPGSGSGSGLGSKDKPGRDEVALEVDGLRDARTGMVQRDEQVLWVYQTLREVLARAERARQRARSESRGRHADAVPGRGGSPSPAPADGERGREAHRGRESGRGRPAGQSSLSRLREGEGEGRSESRDGRRGRGYADMRGSSEED
ncbi:phosphatases II [Calocera cornea HHB12733]|uniref:Phosphatases II n=1 Tax=Calocera cornea HHB12733 TaxID=1353952 RepID=A0A165EG65_9BASI|nr:phosphatases II [Calocera cornea HHB12733]